MAEPIQGTQNVDTLYGTVNNDKLLGHQGDDIFDLTQSTGSDTADGQGGMDTAIFAGRFEDYLLTLTDTGNLKTTVAGLGLNADLKYVERLLFDNATYDVATHTAKITTVSVSDALSVSEGSASPQLTFTFNRTGDLSRGLDVKYTLDGTATTGSDYIGPAVYTVHFNSGSATATLSLAVQDDAIFEGSETVDVHLVADSHYNFGAQVSATGTILDNDPNASPLLHVSNAAATEGGNLVFHVSIDAATDHDITFQAFTDTGTHLANPTATSPTFFGNATAGNLPGGDYDGFTPTTYTIHAGDTSVDISVHTRVDFVNEGTETMSLRIQNASGATITPGVGTGRGVGTITDEPVTKVSYYADPSHVAAGTGFNDFTEGNDLTFHFHRDVATSALDVHYVIASNDQFGGATPGVDFTADGTSFVFNAGANVWTDPSMKVHFDAGQTDVTLVFHTTADGVPEPGGEAFALQWDFAANGNHVQYDGAASLTAYQAAGGINQTQVNIGHILDI